MLASGTECELACEDGYEIVGAQPSCTAGTVSFSATCRCNTDETCSREALPTVPVGEEDLALYAPEAPDPTVRPRPPPRTTVAAVADEPSTQEAPPQALVQEAPEASSSVNAETGMVVGGAVAVLLLLGVAKSRCCSKPSISPRDVAAVTKMAPVDPSAQSMELEGKVETTDNSLFSGMTITTF